MNKAALLNSMKLKQNPKTNSFGEKINNTPENANISSVSNIFDERHSTLSAYKAFKGSNMAVSFGANPLKPLASKLEKFDKWAAEKFPHRIKVKTFKENYAKVKRFDEDDAEQMLKIAAEKMGIKTNGKKLEIQDITDAAKKYGDKVILGPGSIYKTVKNVIKFLIFPVEVLYKAGKGIVNLGIKGVKKLFGVKNSVKPSNAEEKSSFDSVQFYKNSIRWAKKAEKIEAKVKIKVSDEVKAYNDAKSNYGMNKDSFSPKTMNYGADQLSTFMKLTGVVCVPFLAVDAYNVTLGETKDKKTSKDKMSQRAVQDTTRQGISFWFVKSFNNITKGLSNGSLPGAALSTTISTVAYESLTRMLIGQPLVPTTHEKMAEIEKERSSSKKNWLIRVMAGKIKTGSNLNAVAESKDNADKKSKTEEKQLGTQAPQVSMNSIDFNNSRVAELYKKFSTNSLN